jgi:hypothetical protein
MDIRVIREPIARDESAEIAKQQFGEMVKDVVDVGTGRHGDSMQHLFYFMVFRYKTFFCVVSRNNDFTQNMIDGLRYDKARLGTIFSTHRRPTS